MEEITEQSGGWNRGSKEEGHPTAYFSHPAKKTADSAEEHGQQSIGMPVAGVACQGTAPPLSSLLVTKAQHPRSKTPSS